MNKVHFFLFMVMTVIMKMSLFSYDDDEEDTLLIGKQHVEE